MARMDSLDKELFENCPSPYILHVTIEKAEDIAVADIFSSDPFIEIYGGMKLVGKTTVIKSTVNPVWNESFSMVLFEKGKMALKLYDKDITASEFLGFVEVDINSLAKTKESAESVTLPIQQSTSKYQAKGKITFSAYIIEYENIVVTDKIADEKKKRRQRPLSDLSVKIYGANASAPTRCVLAFCEQANVPYEFIPVELSKKEHKTAQFLAMNPLGKVPVMEDDGFFLFEAHAIVAYLARRQRVYDRFFSEDLRTSALVEQYLHAHHTTIRETTDAVVQRHYFALLTAPPPLLAETNELKADCFREWQRVDLVLATRPYLAGVKPTIADMSCACELMQLYNFYEHLELSSLLNLHRWYANVQREFPSLLVVEGPLLLIRKVCDRAIAKLPFASQDLVKFGSIHHPDSKRFLAISQFEVKETNWEQFQAMARELAEETVKETGCVTFEWTRVDFSPELFDLVEIWESRDYWRNHHYTPHHLRLGPLMRPFFRLVRYESMLPMSTK